MILSYKQQFPWNKPTNFKRKIKDGDKKHTIRLDIHNRWKPGMKIHHAHGVRTPYYDCFLENECISTQKFEIRNVNNNDFSHTYQFDATHQTFFFKVLVDDRELDIAEIDLLASNDGFDSTRDFFRWFPKSFIGKIIHWTELKY